MTARWGMTVDVGRCVGCQTCTVACKHWNDTQPGVQWRKVLDVELGQYPDVERLFLLVGCQHCGEPPCVPVCPTGATRQRDDGLVIIDYDICIGCAYCAVSCPYQARTMVRDHQWYYGEATSQERSARHRTREGVAQKCTFCIDRIDRAPQLGLTPGVDPDVTPACAASCIAGAIQFGDMNDPDSRVSRMIREHPSFQMHAELGTDPQIRYLYSTPAAPAKAPPDETLLELENPLVGPRQTFWDWRAAMNWCFGGLASGLALAGWLLYLLGAVPGLWLALCNLVAGAAMAVGLFCVWLKIGRRFRAWRALGRPQSSWMTRELYSAAVLYAGIGFGLLRPDAAILTVTALAAAAFLFCQARILARARGIPAWRAPLLPWLVVASGLLEGAAVLLLYERLVAPVLDTTGLVGVVGALAALTALNGGLWLAYVRSARAAGIPPLARQALQAVRQRLLWFGQTVPLLGFLIMAVLHLAGGLDMASDFAAAVLSLLAALAIAGGLLGKYGIVVEAGYQQGYALGLVPQRGHYRPEPRG